MPWWLEPAINIVHALVGLVGEAVNADTQKLEELGHRVELVLEEGRAALKLAREAAKTEDAQTAKARDEAIKRIRNAGPNP